MDKNILISIVVAVVIAAVFFLFLLQMRPSEVSVPANSSNNVAVNTTPGPVLGGDRDEHGCIPSAGYTWCEAKQNCLRTWEEPCEEPRFGKKLGEAINEKWGFKGTIYMATREIGDEGWLRGSLNVPNAAEYASLCAIFMRGNLTWSLDDGTTLNNHNPVIINGKSVCEITLKNGLAKPCGTLTLHMDMNSMKAGYNKTRDNWQDFFTCAPSVNTAYCIEECNAMMDVLMSQERRPMVN